MKKITLLLAAAAIIGVGSAFTAASGEDCYKDASGVFHLKVGNGTCVTELTNNCNYTYIGEGEAGIDQNEENYSADGLTDRRWQPTP